MIRNVILLLLFCFLPVTMYSQQAQWRGPERNGHYPDSNLLKAWPETGPALLLQVEGIGEGYSTPVESNGIIYVTGKKLDLDYLSAIKEDSIIWQVPYGKAWTKSYAFSRSTPTVEGDRVYVISGTGRLACIDALSGEEIWGVFVDSVFKANYHFFGLAESPLIVDDLVISTPCGDETTMVAYNKYSGDLVWQSPTLNSRRSYVSPVLYEHNGIRLILGFTSKDLIAVNPENGDIEWTYPYFQHTVEEGMEETGINMTNTPIYKDNEIFITSGYNCPSVMLTLSEDGKSVSEKWVNATLDNHHHGVILYDNHIYASNFYSNAFGKWLCVNWDTGEVMWLEKWNSKGNIIMADDMLYLYEEKRGFVGLLKPDPKKFEIISSFQIKEGKGPHWSHPSINSGKFLIRHGDVLQVYNLRQD